MNQSNKYPLKTPPEDINQNSTPDGFSRPTRAKKAGGLKQAIHNKKMALRGSYEPQTVIELYILKWRSFYKNWPQSGQKL